MVLFILAASTVTLMYMSIKQERKMDGYIKELRTLEKRNRNALSKLENKNPLNDKRS